VERYNVVEVVLVIRKSDFLDIVKIADRRQMSFTSTFVYLYMTGRYQVKDKIGIQVKRLIDLGDDTGIQVIPEDDRMPPFLLAPRSSAFLEMAERGGKSKQPNKSFTSSIEEEPSAGSTDDPVS